CRATLTTTSLCVPGFPVIAALASDRVATCFGKTVMVVGAAGSRTLTFGFCLAIGSLLKGIGAEPRSSRLYVPGATPEFTLTSTFASFLSAGTVIGWLLLTTRLGMGSA